MIQTSSIVLAACAVIVIMVVIMIGILAMQQTPIPPELTIIGTSAFAALVGVEAKRQIDNRKDGGDGN